MKGNETKASTSRSRLKDYELQRLQNLKCNVERMSARGSGFLANKILEEKTKVILSPDAEDISDDSMSEYDGENEDKTMEDDSIAYGKRKVSKQNQSVRTQQLAIVEMNSLKRHLVGEFRNNNSTEYSKKIHQQEHQIGSKNKGKKRAFCSPGSMSAYLEFRRRQKENNEVFEESNRSVPNENNDNDAPNENDPDDGMNETIDGVETHYEVNQELDRQVVAQMEGIDRQELEEIETQLSSKGKKHRGPTMLPKVHARTREERQMIILNSFGQPIGPTKEIVQEFKFFLGTVARDSELAPLNYINFPSLPTLDKIWDYVQEKYMVPHAGIIWVMDAVNRAWKYHKCQIKKNTSMRILLMI